MDKKGGSIWYVWWMDGVHNLMIEVWYADDGNDYKNLTDEIDKEIANCLRENCEQ